MRDRLAALAEDRLPRVAVTPSTQHVTDTDSGGGRASLATAQSSFASDALLAVL